MCHAVEGAALPLHLLPHTRCRPALPCPAAGIKGPGAENWCSFVDWKAVYAADPLASFKEGPPPGADPRLVLGAQARPC